MPVRVLEKLQKLESRRHNGTNRGEYSEVGEVSHHDLGVELVQQGEGGVLAPPQARELVVAVPRHREEGVTPVHQVTLG